jgi:hypothetical protein
MIRHLALALLLAAPLAAQPATVPARRAFSHARHIRMEFHAPSKWTIVELMPMALDEGGRTELRTSFRFPGHAPTSTPASLTFALIARDAGELFGAKPAMTLVLDDGAPIAVPAQRFARPVGARTTETTVYATMPRATFLRLTSATRAEVRVEDRRWTLAPDMLEALRDLASRMSPAGYRAAKAAAGTVAARDDEADTASATRTFLASEVDTPVRPRGLLARPRFPVDAPATRRRVWFRYVVDTVGSVDLRTLRGETPTADSLFIDALRGAAGRWLFVPAKKEGRAVRMEVRQVFEFVPGT